MSSKILHLFEDDCTSSSGSAISWNRIDVPAGVTSLPMLVELSLEQLRDEYLRWNASLAEAHVGHKTLAEVLYSNFYNGSFWWSTLVAQRSPMLSSHIFTVYKLRALECFYNDGSYQGLTYTGSNEELHRILDQWCKSIGHEYTWQHPSARSRKSIAGKAVQWLKNTLAHPIEAFLEYYYFLRHRFFPVFTAGQGRATPLPDADLSVITYMPNFNHQAARQGEFQSNYWGPLNRLISELGIKVNWVWIYAESTDYSYRKTAKLRHKLNETAGKTGQKHLLLADRFRLGSLGMVLLMYVRLYLLSFKCTSLKSAFQLPGSAINFFTVLKDDWYGSFRGSHAVKSCLEAAAFHDLIGDLPEKTKQMLYIWENQGWEQHMLMNWQATSGRKASAFAHAFNSSTTMDLRANLGEDSILPPSGRRIPDRLIAMGRIPAENLRNMGWPGDSICVAESLRQSHFADAYATCRHDLPPAGRSLLVITGYLLSESRFQLELLSKADQYGGLSRYSEIMVKPHPFCPLEAELNDLQLSVPVRIEKRMLAELFTEVDSVYAANSTSAAIEVAWVGLPLILCLPYEAINFNPLRDVEGVTFVGTPEQLARELSDPARINLPPDMYLFNENAAKWRALFDTFRN